MSKRNRQKKAVGESVAILDSSANIQAKAADPWWFPLLLTEGAAQWINPTYIALSKEGYQKSVYVFAAINKMAQAFSRVPWLLFQGEDELEKPHPLKNLLKRPNKRMSGVGFRKQFVAYYMLSGNVFFSRVGPLVGAPRELYQFRPDRVSIDPDYSEDGGVRRYLYQPNTKQQVIYQPEEILHIKTFNPLDDYVGFSPLVAAARSIDQNNSAKEWNVATLQNGARPSGLLSVPGRLEVEQRKVLEDNLRNKYGGAKNGGRPMVLEAGATWQPMSHSAAEMQWLESQTFSAREIALALGVPPVLLGDTAAATYANYGEANKAFYNDTVIPLLELFRDEMNFWLTPLFDKSGSEELRLEIDLDSIEAIHEARDAKWGRANDAFTAGTITKNEARGEMGFDKAKDGDSYAGEAQAVATAALPQGRGSKAEAQEVELEAKNALSEETKVALWRGMEIKRGAFYEGVEAEVAKRFEKEAAFVVAAFEKNPANLTTALKTQEKEWTRLLVAVGLVVADEFAQGLMGELENPPQAKAMFETPPEVLKWLNSYLLKTGAAKVTNILATTRKDLAAALADGVAAKEGIPAIAKRLRAAYAEMGTKRATVIARTEVIAASNAGRQAVAETYDDEDEPLEKIWVSTRDGRTREGHTSADGQVKAINKPFKVNGQKLMFPGDSSQGASGDNVIQCRCVCVYRRKGDE